jgi:sodium-dependent dicarboxylate transporter 2/3/5
MGQVTPSGGGIGPNPPDAFDRTRRRAGVVIGPLAFTLLLVFPLPGVDLAASRLAAVLALVITFWVTEVLPLPVTALAGPALAVMLGIVPAGSAFAPFADPLIFLFIGSFIISQATFVHGLNERIAYGVMSWRIVGARPGRILVAYGCVAAFISSWMSNTATAAMLLPVGMSLLAFMEKEGGLGPRYGTALMLAMAYGCSLGGMATIVGTPPNAIAQGMIADVVGVNISFLEWMLFGVPVATIMVGFLVIYLSRIGASGSGEIPGADAVIARRVAALGPWKRGERNVLVAFLVTVTLWIVPGVVELVLGEDHVVASVLSSSFPTAVAAVIGATLLFVLPLDRQRSTITWAEASRIDWGTILLFGGGLALGQMTFDTGLAEAFGTAVTSGAGVSSVVTLTFASALFATIASETMSNTAAANIAVPVVIGIAQAAGINPIPPAVAASLAASVSVLLPVSTPANAIVYSTGKVPITQMIRYGIVMDAVAIVVVPAFVLLYFVWL